MNKTPLILRVRSNRTNNQKVVTIPKDSDIQEGDYVKIEKHEVQ